MECFTIEPCHNRNCDGLDEVVSLLPNGRIWHPDRGDLYGRWIHALGHVKTELNKRICQEFNELDPCKSVRLFGYWAKVYSLPECVPQTSEKLCDWIDLIYGDCPIGSLGFYRRAIDFVAPGKGIELNVNLQGVGANCWCADSFCADNNAIVITAPPTAFYYDQTILDEIGEMQDGENCRRYFIPEIECLRRCVFPFGLSLGYKTNPISPNGADIYNVPIQNIADYPIRHSTCDAECVFD